ncbi:hypothetical protein [Candidatus Leptofilum sp.]|uniref:hypothetical protein n=1 Tax=Candidatus Leptofilum sp. TaxID=3241576 RepID=UPI003B5C9648
MVIDEEVSRALNELAQSTNVIGPVVVDNHINYVIRGLADTVEQFTNLSWCLLGFVGRIFETDMSIDSAIGEGTTATNNLLNTLENRLKTNQELTLAQKERMRDPLIQELISHVLLLIHQRQEKMPDWLGTITAISQPHLSVNNQGIDLIAIGLFQNNPIPIIGEVKAKEKDPWGGLNDACEKFTQTKDGEYDDEIRSALKDISRHSEPSFTKEQLANNIWRERSHFGALVGHDCQYGTNGTGHIDVDFSSNRQEILKQDPERLFFISSPFESMRDLFDNLTKELVLRAKSLSD